MTEREKELGGIEEVLGKIEMPIDESWCEVKETSNPAVIVLKNKWTEKLAQAILAYIDTHYIKKSEVECKPYCKLFKDCLSMLAIYPFRSNETDYAATKIKEAISAIQEKKFERLYYEALEEINELRTDYIKKSEVELDEKKIRLIITEYGQLTSKYSDKKHLLAGNDTFISASQYDDLAHALASNLRAIEEM